MQRLVEHGFAGIPWDTEFLRVLPERVRSGPPPAAFKRVWDFVDTPPALGGVDLGNGLFAASR